MLTEKQVQEFTYNGRKIKPSASNDWTIKNIESTYSGKDYIILESVLTNVLMKFNVTNFFKIIKDKNITIIGDKIEGYWFLSAHGNFFPGEMFEEYNKALKEIKFFTKKELIPGNKYIDINKKEFVFLGSRYTSHISSLKITKPSLKYYALDSNGEVFTLNSIKIVENLGKSLKLSEVDIKLQEESESPFYVYFSKDRAPSNGELIFEDSDSNVNESFFYKTETNHIIFFNLYGSSRIKSVGKSRPMHIFNKFNNNEIIVDFNEGNFKENKSYGGFLRSRSKDSIIKLGSVENVKPLKLKLVRK